MKRILPIFLILSMIVGANVLIPNKAYACSCATGISTEDRFNHSDVVFTGTLVSKDEDGGHIFKVHKVWKGKLTDGYIYNGLENIECGFKFNVGVKYLVYTMNLSSTERLGFLGVENREDLLGKEAIGFCNGSKSFPYANGDVQIIKQFTAPDWKNYYILLIAVISAIAISVLIWRVRLRFKK